MNCLFITHENNKIYCRGVYQAIFLLSSIYNYFKIVNNTIERSSKEDYDFIIKKDNGKIMFIIENENINYKILTENGDQMCIIMLK